jgi:hypothetical protein
VPPAPCDRRIVVVATISIIVAGLLIAGAILAVTSRASPPKITKPVAFGVARSLHQRIDDGGPVAYAGTTGDTGFWLALEQGKLVALKIRQPGPGHCNVRWKGSVNSFVDCHGDKVRIDRLARYPVEIPRRGDQKGLLLVDLRHTDPPPAAS